MQLVKEALQGKKHVIWDWNGTLLDDLDFVVDIMAAILEEHGLETLNREKYLALFGFPVIEYYRKLGFDFEKIPFATLSDKFIDSYKKGIASCKLHDGAAALLREIRASGVTQSVLSAAHEVHLRELLAGYGILDCFHYVYGLSDHHAAGKIERGLELIAAAGIAPKDSILVGDTDHDLEVGRAMGVDVLLLGDGHQSYERLRALHDRVLLARK